jgi:hypothetical protein
MEADLGPVRVQSDNLWKVQRTIEAAGIQFIDQHDGGGVGVRLREPEQY